MSVRVVIPIPSCGSEGDLSVALVIGRSARRIEAKTRPGAAPGGFRVAPARPAGSASRSCRLAAAQRVARLRPVDSPLFRSRWLAPALLAAGLVALHAGALVTGFVNDDYLFLEQVRRHGFVESILQPGGLGNYFRPLSRELWFTLVGPFAGGEPLVFHLVQMAVFLGALLLLADLLGALVPKRGTGPSAAVLAGVLWFGTLPFQRVNLAWVSCAQDLLALAGVLGSLALHRRGRTGPAIALYAAATLAKESALPLPALVFLWDWRIAGVAPRRALFTALGFAAAALPWAAGELVLRQNSIAASRLAFDGTHLAASLVHMLQAFAGVEHAAGWLRAWADARPSLPAFVLLGLVAAVLPDRAAPLDPDARPVRTRESVTFALAWCVLFALPTWPVAYFWSGYYDTLAAVGAAVLVALAAGRLARWSWVVFAGALLWWHAAGIAPRAFALREDPWIATSHVTPYYIERASRLSRELRASLVRVVPKVVEGTRFFFVLNVSWAGFQMGNGASVRQLYRDDSLESHFYSTFSEATAGRQPLRFLFWNGVEFEPLYARERDPLFQVGSDLLLLDRPGGAVWAFRRGLDEGGERLDHWYGLGWAALWSGRRSLAESAWREWGARDDSTAYVLWLRKAKGSLEDGDTLTARRQLVEAVRTGIGRPEAHAVLGSLLRRVNTKYALLETKIAAELNPADWLERQDLVAGLVEARLDEPARAHLAHLKRLRPQWQDEPEIVRLDERLRQRGPSPAGVAEFGPGGGLR